MRARNWVIAVAGVTVAAGAAAVVYRVRTAGYAEVREVTERVAAAMAIGDLEAIRAEPTFRDDPDTADWLVTHRRALAAGYRVSVQRNGAKGHQLLDLDSVSHLGVIQTPTGDITLGFRRDPAGGGFRFVTASSMSIGPAPAGESGSHIRVGPGAAEAGAAPERPGE